MPDLIDAVAHGDVYLVQVPAGATSPQASRLVTVPVLAAVSGASWEAELVAALEGDADGVTVVRRCVDLADLLAAAVGRHRARRPGVGRPAPARPGCAGPARRGPGRGRRAVHARRRGGGARLRLLGVDARAARRHRRRSTSPRPSSARARRTRSAGAGGRSPRRRGASRCEALPDADGPRSTPRRRSSPGPAGWSRSGARPVRRAAPPSRWPSPPSSRRPGCRRCWRTPTSTAASWRRCSASSTRHPAWLPRRGWPTTVSSTSPRSPRPHRRPHRTCGCSPASPAPNGGPSCGRRRSSRSGSWPAAWPP